MNTFSRTIFLCFTFTIVVANDQEFFNNNQNGLNTGMAYANEYSSESSNDESLNNWSNSDASSNDQIGSNSSSSSSSSLLTNEHSSAASSLTKLFPDSSGLLSLESSSSSSNFFQFSVSTTSSSSSIASSEKTSSSVSSSASTGSGMTGVSDSDLSNSTSNIATNSSTEKEKVILPGEDELPVSYTKTIFRQTLVWLNDTYTLSILIPVVAGVVFASTIIITVATCKCIRRRMYRRKLRRKILPESVKNMRPSDRARLLAETSDDEF